MDAATLIDAIVDDPTAIDRWLVYADWLLDRGDPRGELINLELAIEAGTADADAQSRVNRLRRDEERLFTQRFAEQSHYWHLELWRGFVRGVELIGASDDLPGAEAVAALCAEPHAALLERVSIRAEPEVIAPLFATPHRRLTMLNTSCIDADRLAASTPALESLRILGERSLADRELPHLRTYPVTTLEHPYLRELVTTGVCCPALVTGDFVLPELRELHLGRIDTTDPMLENQRSIFYRPPPRLAHLDVSLGAESAGLEILVATPELVARVSALPAVRAARSLSFGSAGVDVLEALAANPSPLVHLERLEIRLLTFNFLPELEPAAVDDLRARIEAAFPHTELEIGWNMLLPFEPPEAEAAEPLPPIDAQSRRPDGTVDAMGAFARRQER